MLEFPRDLKGWLLTPLAILAVGVIAFFGASMAQAASASTVESTNGTYNCGVPASPVTAAAGAGMITVTNSSSSPGSCRVTTYKPDGSQHASTTIAPGNSGAVGVPKGGSAKITKTPADTGKWTQGTWVFTWTAPEPTEP